ncbi:MAG: hypothetical protein ACO1N0_14850 [Fluviicola sp.]
MLFTIQSFGQEPYNSKIKAEKPTRKEILKNTSRLEIYVEYAPDGDCERCPDWKLVKAKDQRMGGANGERIYIKYKKTSNLDDLVSLAEKQTPLVLRLNGDYIGESMNTYRVFEYAKYQMVEL